jgi:hypothetical protein
MGNLEAQEFQTDWLIWNKSAEEQREKLAKIAVVDKIISLEIITTTAYHTLFALLSS